MKNNKWEHKQVLYNEFPIATLDVIYIFWCEPDKQARCEYFVPFVPFDIWDVPPFNFLEYTH